MLRNKDAAGMKGYRKRSANGELRKKRDDTLIATIEHQYNIEFGVRGNMKLGNFLKKYGFNSLNDAIHNE